MAAKAALDELQPDHKRQRVEDDAEDADPTQPPSEWSRTTFLREESRDSNRRSKPIVHDAPQLPMKDGRSDGYMTHPRHGIAGNVQRWARGSQDNVIKIILRLIKWFGVEDDIRKSFGEKAAKTASIDALIVDRVAAVLQVLKEGGSEQVRIAYRIVLSAVAPPLVEQGHHGDDGKFDGAAAAVAARVGVTPGRRPATAAEKAAGQKGRPFAFLASQIHRHNVFDVAAAKMGDPYTVGDAVLSRGQPATLIAIHGEGCTLEFRVGSAYEEVTFSKMWASVANGGHRKGCARLQRPPPSIYPPPLATRSDATNEKVAALVYAHYLEKLARSPHQRDGMRRLLAPRVWEHEQALILTETYDELYESFNVANPDLIGRTKFIELRPWCIKKAYRETCLCTTCENLNLYADTLKQVAKELEPLLTAAELETEDLEAAAAAAAAATTATATAATATEAAETAEATTAEATAAAETMAAETVALKKLVDFCSLPLKSSLINGMVCSGCLDTAADECRNGTCKSCGFHTWSAFVRNGHTPMFIPGAL